MPVYNDPSTIACPGCGKSGTNNFRSESRATLKRQGSTDTVEVVSSKDVFACVDCGYVLDPSKPLPKKK